MSKDERKIMKKIEYVMHADIEPPRMFENGDWVDLRSAEDVWIPLNTYRLISLGISMRLPDGYEAQILPRSSTFKTWGIIQTNHMGVIDNSYSGTNDVWHFPAYCLESREFRNNSTGTMIHKGDRICQFRIVKSQEPINFEQVKTLDNTGRGGFGSTGAR